MSVEQEALTAGGVATVTDRTSSIRELGYVGAIDGLRAVAVLAVIVFHFWPTLLGAGFLGVDVFFVVSGFLIARLVVREMAGTGGLGLAHFWGRRARRLLPALGTVTVAVLIASAVSFSSTEMHDVLAHALGTLFYVANWVFIARGASYFATVGRPSPFLHMWSLAIEEQFYVIFPLVAVAGRKYIVRHPVRAAVIAGIGALISTIWMALLVSPLDDPSRAYLGTGSHAMGLLIGVAIGILAGAGAPWQRIGDRVRATRNTRLAATVLGFATLAGIIVTMYSASDRTYDLYRGGFTVFSLAAAVVICVVVMLPSGPLARLLGSRPLVTIGLRSYSLYLWHWPVRVFIEPHAGFTGWRVGLARVIWTVALTEASYRFIERPFRSGAIAKRVGTRGAVAYFAATVVAAGALLATVDRPEALPPNSLSGVAGQDPSGRRVDLFGDSTGLVFGLAGAKHSHGLHVVVGGDARLGCGLVVTDHISRGRVIANLPECNDWRDRWRGIVQREPQATLAVMAGAWDVLDQRLPNGETVKFGTPEWTHLVTTSVHDAFSLLTSTGRDVYVFEVPCYGEGDPSDPLPERADRRRIDAMNGIYAQEARENHHVKIVRWRKLVCPNGKRAERVEGKELWQNDQVHLSANGAVEVWKWWLPQLSDSS